MICKAKDDRASGDAWQAAGDRAERQMEFYLRRAFGEAADVLVFNDLRLVLDEAGDAAQVDHLIVHRHGMAIVESKSVTSKVKINPHGEWMRWWNGEWEGMPSPVEQAQRQADGLRGLLQRHREELRDKKLFGLLRGGFRSCPIDIFIAISDDGMFDERSARPPRVIKAEAVVGAMRDLMERHRKGATFLGAADSKPAEGMYLLTEGEAERVKQFLVTRHTPRSTGSGGDAAAAGRGGPAPVAPVAAAGAERPPTAVAAAAKSVGGTAATACKHCGAREGEAQWGKFGYYLRCGTCGKNTGLPKTCAACGREGRIRKDGTRFWRECLTAEGGCGAAVVAWENRA